MGRIVNAECSLQGSHGIAIDDVEQMNSRPTTPKSKSVSVTVYYRAARHLEPLPTVSPVVRNDVLLERTYITLQAPPLGRYTRGFHLRHQAVSMKEQQRCHRGPL